MDVLREMRVIRALFYENGDKARTVDGYRGILSRAKAQKAPIEHIVLCTTSIGMVLHEQNRIPEAIAAYDEALNYPLPHSMRAAVLQNQAAALVVDHQCGRAVQTINQALHYAQRAANPKLVKYIIENLRVINSIASSPNDSVIVAAVVHRGPDLEDKVKEN